MDQILFNIGDFSFTIRNLLILVLMIGVSRIGIIIAGKVLTDFFREREIDPQDLEPTLRLIRYFTYAAGFLIGCELINFNFYGQLDQRLFSTKDFVLTTGKVLIVVAVLVTAKLISYLLGPLIMSYLTKRKVDQGRKFAIIQFLRYLLYFVAVMVAFFVIDLKLTVIWGGALGLLVGIGFGIQQIFYDWFSGIVLLMEASVEVGDVIQYDNEVVKVESIGVRSSKVITREDVVIIVPNSQLVGNSVINWSNNHKSTRFQVNVGVSYGSDVQLVSELLMRAVKEHRSVLNEPLPKVMFKDFGESSLDFSIFFYSNDFFYIEFIKSDLRYRITELFREYHIEIPFPQRDVWIKQPKST